MKNSINGLDLDTKLIFFNQYNIFAGFPKIAGPLKKWQDYWYQVYGLNKLTSNQILEKYYDREFDTRRHERSDKGHTIVNCTKKRGNYTPFNVFKREQTQQKYRNSTHC